MVTIPWKQFQVHVGLCYIQECFWVQLFFRDLTFFTQMAVFIRLMLMTEANTAFGFLCGVKGLNLSSASRSLIYAHFFN